MHVLHQDLPIGTGGLATVQDPRPYRRHESNVHRHQARPEALTVAARDAAKVPISSSVIVIGTPKFCADAIAKWRSGGGRHQIYTLSYVPAGLLTKVVGEGGPMALVSPRLSRRHRAASSSCSVNSSRPAVRAEHQGPQLLSSRRLRVSPGAGAGLCRAGARPTASTLRAALGRHGRD